MFPDFQKTWVEKTPTMSFFPMVGVFSHESTTSRPKNLNLIVPFVWPFFGRFDFKFLWPKKIINYPVPLKVHQIHVFCLWVTNVTNCWKRDASKKKPALKILSFLNPTVSPEFSPPFGVQTPPEIYAFEQLAMRRGNAWKMLSSLGISGYPPTGEEGLIEWLRGYEASLVP